MGTSISFTGLLAIIFVIMKVMGWGMVATWSWIWVLSPLWIPAASGVVFFAIVAGLAFILNK